MLSLHDVALTVTIAQVVLLLGHKWFVNAKSNREITDNDDCRERHAKTSVKAPEAFSGSIGDWTPWKISTRSIFGFMGLTQILDDRDHALRHPVKNTTVHHFLCQAVVKWTASSAFSRATFVCDGSAAWRQLMGRHEGNTQKEPDAKRVRALLSNLRLDLRTSGYDYQNFFQDHA